MGAMNTAALAAVAALLAAHNVAAVIGPILSSLPIDTRPITKTYTGRARENDTQVFSNQLVLEQTLQGAQKILSDLFAGRAPTPAPPATPKKKIELECLNSVAPEPLNWKMWCPSDANITDWVDTAGATHRQVTLRPQPEVTATQVVWFITNWVTGNGPMNVTFRGKDIYWYHLWHPIDHVYARNMIAPSTQLPGLPALYTLINERYRQPASFNYTRRYETDAWFLVDNPAVNLMKNRFHVGINNLGIWSWQLLVEFRQTPAGLVVDLEVIVGSPPKGWDERNPLNGNLLARQINDNLLEPQFRDQRGGLDWVEGINAITRHMVEEFSNLRHFVPELYARYAPLAPFGINSIPSIDGNRKLLK